MPGQPWKDSPAAKARREAAEAAMLKAANDAFCAWQHRAKKGKICYHPDREYLACTMKEDCPLRMKWSDSE
jgi:hypothetical protein